MGSTPRPVALTSLISQPNNPLSTAASVKPSGTNQILRCGELCFGHEPAHQAAERGLRQRGGHHGDHTRRQRHTFIVDDVVQIQ